MSLIVVTNATTEPLTIQDAKDFLRLEEDDSEQDLLIGRIIKVARERVEEITNRSFMSKTYKLTLDGFPKYENGCDAPIELLPVPVISVSSIKYLAESSGVETDLAVGLYTTDLDSEPARIVPAYDEEWPDTRDIINAVRVTFVAGYASLSAMPEELRHAMRFVVSHFFENRELFLKSERAVELPKSFDWLLVPKRVYNFR